MMKRLLDVYETWAPSMIYKTEDIERILRLSTRVYYIYSIVLSLIIQTLIRFNFEHFGYFMLPIALQAGVLFYTFEAYRRFFAISPAIRNSILLRIGFFFWLILILLAGVEQIMPIPFILGGLMFLLTGNENFASIEDPTLHSWFITIFSLVLGIIGEYLLRKIAPKKETI